MKPIDKMSITEWLTLSDEQKEAAGKEWCRNIIGSIGKIWEYPYNKYI